MAAPEPMTKGSNLIDLVKMARKERPLFQGALPASSRDFIETHVLTGSWYPEAHLENLLLAADKVHGKGDLAVCRKLGGLAAESHLHTIYRTLIVHGDPLSTLLLFPAVWNLYHNTGHVAVENPRSGYTRFVLTGFAAPSTAQCASIAGWIESAVRVAGGEGRVEDERCRLRQDDACVYGVHWTPPARA
jgi:hypothetical protein